jgi:hypothetical protein
MLALSPAALVEAAEKTGPPADFSTAIIQVAKQNIPSMVHIEGTERAKSLHTGTTKGSLIAGGVKVGRAGVALDHRTGNRGVVQVVVR